MKPKTPFVLAFVFAAALAFPVRVVTQQAAATNGQIAFTQGDPNAAGFTAVVYVANPDGSHQQQVPLGNPVELFSKAIWSPDGTKLLISHTARPDNMGQCCLFQPATVNPDGSDFNQLSPPNPPGQSSAGMDCGVWFPDQSRILCGLGDGVYSLRASDGGEPIKIATNPYSAIGGFDYPSDISPDGTRFVFLRFKPSAGPTGTPKPDQQVALFVANLDGTNIRQITPYLLLHQDIASAKWSPDGVKIISETNQGHLFVVYPDGGGVTPINLRVGTQKYVAFNADWSPDGSRIIFNMFINGGEGLFTANPDGSDVVQVAFNGNPAMQYSGPDWGVHPLAQ
jgi:Tol biopolymer transport system component